MNFDVTINVLHADGTLTMEYRAHEHAPVANLGYLIERAYRDAVTQFGADVALDLTITEA